MKYMYNDLIKLEISARVHFYRKVGYPYIHALISTDTEVPVISSTPSTQNVNTAPGSPNATVSWTPPTASDNSGAAVTLTSDYSPGDTFPIGNTAVTYTATDSYGNTDTSSFYVLVTGKCESQLDNGRKYQTKDLTINSYVDAC